MGRVVYHFTVFDCFVMEGPFFLSLWSDNSLLIVRPASSFQMYPFSSPLLLMTASELHLSAIQLGKKIKESCTASRPATNTAQHQRRIALEPFRPHTLLGFPTRTLIESCDLLDAVEPYVDVRSILCSEGVCVRMYLV